MVGISANVLLEIVDRTLITQGGWDALRVVEEITLSKIFKLAVHWLAIVEGIVVFRVALLVALCLFHIVEVIYEEYCERSEVLRFWISLRRAKSGSDLTLIVVLKEIILVSSMVSPDGLKTMT